MTAATKMGRMGRLRKNPFPKPKTFRQRFVARLHELADKAGVIYEDIATECDVSKIAVQGWFSGTYLPELEKLPDIARALKVKTSDLLPD